MQLQEEIRDSGFGYAYIPAVSQYSAGVLADEGYAITRYTLSKLVPISEAFTLIEQRLKEQGLPLTSVCAFELRSPSQFSEEGFKRFNDEYVGRLAEWGIIVSDENPVARSNVCPAVSPPQEPSVYAFCVVTPTSISSERPFIVSGSGEAPEGRATYREHTVAAGDTSDQGIERKTTWVMGEMQRRLAHLSRDWSDVAAAQIYTVHDFYTSMTGSLSPLVAVGCPLAWYFCRPPIQGLEFEMDCRRVTTEQAFEMSSS